MRGIMLAPGGVPARQRLLVAALSVVVALAITCTPALAARRHHRVPARRRAHHAAVQRTAAHRAVVHHVGVRQSAVGTSTTTTTCDSWVGTSGNWNDPTNWSAGVPSSVTNVCIAHS